MIDKGEHMRKLVMLIVVMAALVFSGIALADDTNPGGVSYDTLYGIASDNAQCGTQAGSGAFAAFGNFSEFGIHDYAGGANGYLTGLSNSSVCGNR
jgi:hypothetical protein